MCVLVIAETENGRYRKATQTVVTVGAAAAKSLGIECLVLVSGDAQDPASAGNFGASKVMHVRSGDLNPADNGHYALIVAEVAQEQKARLVVLTHSALGRALAGRLAVRLQCGVATGVNQVSVEQEVIKVARTAFSGKAIEHITLNGDCAVVSVMGNAMPPATDGTPCPVEEIVKEAPAGRVLLKEIKKVEGKIPLPEAEIVVSAGRGMKDPSNWDIVEELADTLGAATACSRPVADSGWRPHHEHVGQTGLAIRPNLYIAIGISGAIQHLAGVNNSKVIVVINKDPEAPFFKAADYGVCADLFEVVPRLTEAIRRFNHG